MGTQAGWILGVMGSLAPQCGPWQMVQEGIDPNIAQWSEHSGEAGVGSQGVCKATVCFCCARIDRKTGPLTRWWVERLTVWQSLDPGTECLTVG